MAKSVETVLGAPWELLSESRSHSLGSREQAIRDIEDRGRAEARVRQDYSGRYPIELLQNAHDACADADQTGKAWFHFSPTALLIGNQGAPFDAQRVEALMRLGSGTKTAADSSHHTIGYKGIGFSAVFEITENPQIVSTGARFQFHRVKAAEKIAGLLGKAPESLPMRGYPIALADADLGEDAQVVASLLDHGAVSVIRLPLVRHSPDDIAAAVRSALSPEVLLFMPHVEHLEFNGVGRSEVWQKRGGKQQGRAHVVHLSADNQSRAWLVASSSEKAPEDSILALDDELWQNVIDVNVAVAIPWKDGRPDPARGPQPLQVYFPTRDLLGRSVLIHGDFYVDSSRTRIATSGPAGEVSECVGAAAAGLLGDLVEELWEHGKPLIDCLAVTGQVDGFGKRVGELITADLEERRFLKAVDGTGPKYPAELQRMGQRTQVAKRIVPLLNDSGDLADLSLEEAPSRELLNELQIATADPVVLAGRVDPALVNAPYKKALDALQAWIDSVEFPVRLRLNYALQRRCVVRCERTGTWVQPGTVVHPKKGVPPLPAELRRDSVELPNGKHHPLFDTFDIPVLDGALALELLLEAVEGGEYGTVENAPDGPLRYLRKLWTSHSAVIKAGDHRLSQILLPVRALNGATGENWCEAGVVYFGPEWVADGAAADIYGPLGVAEFLAQPPPESEQTFNKQLALFRALGVSADPQAVDQETIDIRDRSAWRRSPEFVAAVCPEHGTPRLRLRTPTVPERLDVVLRSGNRASLTALAQYLARQKEPYGQRAELTCTHGWHQTPRRTSAPGLQEFLLKTIPWVPVRDDPGGQDFRTPDEAWILALEAHQRHFLPCADLDEATSARLRLPSSVNPPRTALETALRLLNQVAALRDVFTDEPPAVPDQLWKTADWLLRNLETRLRNINTVVPSGQKPPFPAYTGKTRAWTESPLIPDIPGLDGLQTISVLPAGSWANLRRVYALTPASEVIAIDVQPDRSGPRPPPLLSESDRIDLVAYLDSAGGELEDLARLIGRLEQIPCAGLKLVLSHEDETASVARQYHLERTVEREGRSQVARGRLYIGPDPLLDELSGDLASTYLQKPNLAKDIHLYLLGRAKVLTKLTDDELSVAAEALLKYPSQADLSEEEAPTKDLGAEAKTAARSDGAPASDQHNTPAAGSNGSQSANRSGTDHGSRASQGADARTGSEDRPDQGRDRWAEGHTQSDDTAGIDFGTRTRTDGETGDYAGGRNRMISYIEPADHESQNEDPARTARRNAIDAAGVAAVVGYEIRNGRIPVVLPYGHPGYDIASSGHGSDKPERLIEIKSVDGNWDDFGVGLNPKQFTTAQEERETFWLYVVEHARTAAPRVHTLQDPTAQISSFRLDHKWAAICVDSVEVSRTTPKLLSDEEASEFDDAVAVFDYQMFGNAGAVQCGWIRCPGVDPALHFAAILCDRSLEPLAEPGDMVCIKAGNAPEADALPVLVTIDEQGSEGTECFLSVRKCVSDLDADGSLRAVVLHASEGSGLPSLVVDDPGRLQVHGTLVGVIEGDVMTSHE